MRRFSRYFPVVIATSWFVTIAIAVWATAVHSGPPVHFKKVDTLAAQFEHLPGLGVLYLDPNTLPIGPFTDYDEKGRPVKVIYLVSLKDLNADKRFETVGTGLGSIKVGHTGFPRNP